MNPVSPILVLCVLLTVAMLFNQLEIRDLRKENRALRENQPIFIREDLALVLDWCEEVREEIERARAKFPDNHLLLTAFSEEAGEVVKAALDHYSGKGSLADVRKELIQTAAMVGRLLEEGDPIHNLPPTLEVKS